MLLVFVETRQLLQVEVLEQRFLLGQSEKLKGVYGGGSPAHITVFHGVRTRSGLRVVQVRRLDKINDYGVERVRRQINTRKRFPTKDRLHDLKKLSQDNPAHSTSLHNHTFVFCFLASRSRHIRTFVS